MSATTEPTNDTPKVTHNEVIKEAIPTLAGNIATTIESGTDQFSADDQQFIKFHGIYQQDDRDLRKTGKKFIMMVRGRIPGGVMTAAGVMMVYVEWRIHPEVLGELVSA